MGHEELQHLTRRAGEGAPWVVLLHGFGANAGDLRPLSEMLDPDGKLNWLFPEAPVNLGTGYAGPSRAWFPRNEAELTRAVTGDYFSDLPKLHPSGLDESVEALLSLLSNLGIDSAMPILGGFSQGAIVALWAALRLPEPPAGMILHSTSIIASDVTTRLAASASPTPFVQTHGRGDPILPFAGAEALYTVLTKAGHPGRFIAFDGGHDIPKIALDSAYSFLLEHLPEAEGE